jgi:hypothetical protein
MKCMGKSNFFDTSVDLGLLTQTLEGHGFMFTRMRYLGNLELVERACKLTPPLGREKGAFYRSPQNQDDEGNFTPEILS